MKQFGYLFFVLLFVLGCEGRRERKALLNVDNKGAGKEDGDLKLSDSDPLWERLEVLTKEPDAAKEGVCGALAYLTNDKGRKLLAACLGPIISDPKENVELRRGAMDLLVLTNTLYGIPSLKKAISDVRAEIRGKAGEALLRMKDPAGAEALLAYKGSYNSDHNGIYWLIKYAEILPKDFALKSASSQDGTVRKNSAILLGLVGGEGALGLVSDLAIDPDKDIQAYARKVNFKLSDAQALFDELKRDLKSKNKTTRFIAVEMLGYYGKDLGEADVRAALGVTLNDTDPVVQTKAVESLSLLGGVESNALLVARLSTANNTLAGRILGALIELKDPSMLDEVLGYAEGADLNSRGVDLANCFIAYKDKRSLGFSQKLIASNTPYLHRAGAKMLAAFGAEEALWRPLFDNKDPETRGLAMVAAAKNGAKVEVFAESLKDADLLINTYAHVASLIAKGQ
jgi:HEAT repeat protein